MYITYLHIEVLHIDDKFNCLSIQAEKKIQSKPGMSKLLA